jgi:hypothetical protein
MKKTTPRKATPLPVFRPPKRFRLNIFHFKDSVGGTAGYCGCCCLPLGLLLPAAAAGVPLLLELPLLLAAALFLHAPHSTARPRTWTPLLLLSLSPAQGAVDYTRPLPPLEVRAAAENEPTPYLAEPVFSECTVPILWWPH